ncbi:hypothetical protein [Accumulibacter sp.]|uniref:hypothetical protein n=1 Tax=Accumulibacter sp. TaxID=2053492 RepID=UPI0025EEF121|nr:hypothetical protein [Accumulibacter sp.]MCM8595663.1 hypothetical protein [Accumulibacter sp.]MCM8625993.1 hypothetical protein [Accumulibacter sp.]MDS4049810.1 hypothetical protein [Accumulibacter sp.]
MGTDALLLQARYAECLRRADQFEAIGSLVDAIRHADEAIRIGPELPRAYYVRGRLRRLLDSTDPARLDQAADDFRALLQRDPRHPDGWRLLASTTTLRAAACTGPARSELLTGAYRAFQESARLNPQSATALLDLAEVDLCLARYREAVGNAASAWSVASGGYRIVAAWLAGVANGLLGREPAARKHHDLLCSGKLCRLSSATWCITEVDRYLESLRATGGPPDRCTALAFEVHEAFQALYHQFRPTAH